MVKIKIEKWGSLQGLSVSIPPIFLVVLVIGILMLFNIEKLDPFLKFLTLIITKN